MIKKYADFINNHHASLVYQINTELDIQMEELRKEFIRQIKYYLTPEMPVHCQIGGLTKKSFFCKIFKNNILKFK